MGEPSSYSTFNPKPSREICLSEDMQESFGSEDGVAVKYKTMTWCGESFGIHLEFIVHEGQV